MFIEDCNKSNSRGEVNKGEEKIPNNERPEDWEEILGNKKGSTKQRGLEKKKCFMKACQEAERPMIVKV